MPVFAVNGDDFVLDGKPYRILSGAMHYFRVRPEQWVDRLLKLKAMGLNTVETYVPWNSHEPRPGQFDFSGALDLVRFIELAHSLGLYVIVRPGPYICAEWEFGGLPAWLLADPDMVVRTMYPPYIDALSRFFDALLPRLAPLQIDRGGPVIALQIENEYGSYSNDKEYLGWIEDCYRQHGLDVLLFTSDGANAPMLTQGTLPHVLMTANFGSRAAIEFASLRQHQPGGPLMCMEFWNGWFDHWGEPHHTRDPAIAAEALDEVLAAGASVNIFMFHGGTSFGWMNGANTDLQTGAYQPTVNSYDYDAPLSEDGLVTPKYHAFREVIGRYADLPPLQLPLPTPRLELGPIAFTDSLLLFDALEGLGTTRRSVAPLSMESLGQNYGFVLYRCVVVDYPAGPTPLRVERVHDRAQVFVNGRDCGVIERDGSTSLVLDLPHGTVTVELLVENMGRVNYGAWLGDRKGLLGWVRLGDHTLLHHWENISLPLDDLSGLHFGTRGERVAQPCFHRARFDLQRTGDTHLSLPGWDKGVAWVNGFLLGRYWQRGPQASLYIPQPILRQGENELVVLELHAANADHDAWLQAMPILAG